MNKAFCFYFQNSAVGKDTDEYKIHGGVIKMSASNIGGLSNQANVPINTNKTVNNKPEGGKKSVDDVLATLRELMPGWTISTSTADWGEGFRNIQIDREILQRMADDPREMEKYKTMIMDLENSVEALEKWGQENPGQSIVFELSLNAKGDVTSMSIVKTLMGVETRSVFDLPEEKSTWADLIRQRVEAALQGQVEDEFGSKSWLT